MGIGESIKADHDEFRRVLAKMEKTTEKDIELRKQLLPHFIRILYAHHVAEEETLFPEMEKKEKLRNLEEQIKHKYSTG